MTFTLRSSHDTTLEPFAPCARWADGPTHRSLRPVYEPEGLRQVEVLAGMRRVTHPLEETAETHIQRREELRRPLVETGSPKRLMFPLERGGRIRLEVRHVVGAPRRLVVIGRGVPRMREQLARLVEAAGDENATSREASV